jgi:hypothetical protein
MAWLPISRPSEYPGAARWLRIVLIGAPLVFILASTPDLTTAGLPSWLKLALYVQNLALYVFRFVFETAMLVVLGAIAVFSWLAYFTDLRNRALASKLKRVRVGMSQEQAREIMGAPDEVFVVHDGTGNTAAEGWRGYWFVVRVRYYVDGKVTSTQKVAQLPRSIVWLRQWVRRWLPPAFFANAHHVHWVNVNDDARDSESDS